MAFIQINPEKKAYLELHIAVILFGLTAILGDLISLSALILVWWRVLITSFSLVPILKFKKIPFLPSRKLSWIYFGIGIIVALHWVTFYGAVKLSNASIALVCMATTSFFTAIVEPLIVREKIKKVDLLVGLLVIPGMVLIVNGLEQAMIWGVISGLISALLASLFASLNKRYIDDADSISITFVEMSSAWVFLSLLVPFFILQNEEIQFWPNPEDWFYLIILALLCTTFAYLLSLRALKHLSAFATNLVVNLEPVYGIVLAIVILKEHKELSVNFYWGVTMILVIVLLYPFIQKQLNHDHES